MCVTGQLQQTRHLVLDTKWTWTTNRFSRLNLHLRFLQLCWVMSFSNPLGAFPLLVCISSYKEIHDILHPNSIRVSALSTPRISETIYCYLLISLNIIFLGILRRRGHSWSCGFVCWKARGWVVEVEDPLFFQWWKLNSSVLGSSLMDSDKDPFVNDSSRLKYPVNMRCTSHCTITIHSKNYFVTWKHQEIKDTTSPEHNDPE